jgi:hypothetical protein
LRATLKQSRHHLATLALYASLLNFAAPKATANEEILATIPHPENATDLQGSLQAGFAQRREVPDSLFPGATAWVGRQSEPMKGTAFGYDFRTYYFDRRNSSTSKAKAWTAGGQLTYTSGWWNNLALSANYYSSWAIDAPSDKPGTGLLQPNNDDINVLGELNLRLRISDENGDMQVRLGRQRLDLPFVNKHDIRAVPASHEGITVVRRDSNLDFVIGHLTKFKNYDSQEFVYMSEAAGAPGTDNGLTLIGARASFFDNFTVGAINYFGEDTFDTFYIESEYHDAIGTDIDFRVSAQYTRQTSNGNELIGNFSTDTAGLRFAFGWHDFVFKVARTSTSDDFNVQKPWGGTPSYNSIQRLDFDRAGEESYTFGMSYNAEQWIPGLSGFLTLATGRDAVVPGTSIGLPDRNEYDITFDYKPPGNFWKGLWIRVRANYIDTKGDGENVRDYRVIINFPIRVL